MVRFSKSVYQMNVTKIVNSSQSLCSIVATGAIFSCRAKKKCLKKNNVFNAAVGGKIIHLCKHLLGQNVV